MIQDEFRYLNADDRAIYEKYHKLSGSRISDMCFHSRIAWSPGFHYQIAVVNDMLCLVSDGGIYTEPHLVMPLGEYDTRALADVLETIMPMFNLQHWQMKIMYIDEFKLPLVKALEPLGYDVTIGVNQDYSDYVYDGDSLRTLAGKALHSKRNHMNRFKREHPDYIFSPIQASDAEECLKLVQDWCDEKGIDSHDLCLSDYVPIKRMFKYFDKLTPLGGTIRVDGRIRAFAMGGQHPDGSAVIHFEKADYSYTGLYAVINNRVVNEVFPNAERVNREEDMGLEGLRKAKQSYLPIGREDKFSALIQRKA